MLDMRVRAERAMSVMHSPRGHGMRVKVFGVERQRLLDLTLPVGYPPQPLWWAIPLSKPRA
jgi:hypothetical protein